MKYLILLIICGLCGCSIDKTISLKPEIHQQSIFPQIPITIGLYKTPNLFNFIATESAPKDGIPNFDYSFLIGTASSSLLEKTMAMVFKEVVVISQNEIPSETTKPKLDGIMTVDIERCNPVVSPYENYGKDAIIYRFTFKDTSDRQIASWLVSGDYLGPNSHICPLHPLSGIPYCSVNEAMEAIMIDAMAHFIVTFFDTPEIQNWLKSKGITGYD